MWLWLWRWRCFIARIDLDENGEEVYVDPTDEEFEEVQKAYDELMAEEEE